MNAHTGPISVAPAQLPASRKQARRARREREERDLELVAGVGRRDAEAISALAERIAPRVERIARALMGSAGVDADDAALHALIELLRSHRSYRGKEPLERWAERSAALSVIRFARAVNRRSSQPDAEPTGQAGVPRRLDERSARTFEQYLQALSESARQTLLLRHALGFKLSELGDALKCSASSARQQLLEARAELRGLVRRRGNAPAPLGKGAQRWCELRDREALGDTLRTDELEELAQLEARDPEVWAFVAQVRALELYFESPRSEPIAVGEVTWVARAIAALRVTTPAPSRTSGALETQQLRDLEGSRVVRWLAVAGSVLLAASTIVALLLHEPRLPDLSTLPRATPAIVAPSVRPAPRPTLQPTVEALPKVSSSARGARLRREGRLLAPGTPIAQGDTLEAADRAGCLHIEPDGEACMALGSALRVLSMSARQRQLELVRGRAVVRTGGSDAVQTSLRAGELEVRTTHAVFAVERALDGKLVRVHALRGTVDVDVGGEQHVVEEAKSLTFRAPSGFELVPLVPSLAQRDWDVMAVGLHPSALPSKPRATLPEGQPAAEPADALEAAPIDEAEAGDTQPTL